MLEFVNSCYQVLSVTSICILGRWWMVCVASCCLRLCCETRGIFSACLLSQHRHVVWQHEGWAISLKQVGATCNKQSILSCHDSHTYPNLPLRSSSSTQLLLHVMYGFIIGAAFYDTPKNLDDRSSELVSACVWILMAQSYIHIFKARSQDGLFSLTGNADRACYQGL